MEGQTIGSYVITKQIGEGGMGAVYAAQHTLLGQKVAIKLLLPEMCGQSEVVDRFFNEAKAITAVHHAGIIRMSDFGWHEGRAYMVMELLEGETLAARLRRVKALPEVETIRLARQVASALNAAHSKGVVHRDLKPDNVFIVADDEVEGGERAKVLDFGIAKLSADLGSNVKTRAGTLMGTPTYMAPELCQGLPVDARVDVYALGCVIFEMMRGRPPFVGVGVGDLFAKHITQKPPTMRSFDAKSSDMLEAIVACALAKKPDDRYATMAKMMAALDGGRVRSGTPLSMPALDASSSSSSSSVAATLYESADGAAASTPTPAPAPAAAAAPKANAASSDAAASDAPAARPLWHFAVGVGTVVVVLLAVLRLAL